MENPAQFRVEINNLILIVEDDPDDRALLARAFRKAHVEVPIRFASDGEEALAFLEALCGPAPEPVRLVVVLLDLKLPRRSGFEVLDWLKRHDTLRRVPVVVLTSSQESTDISRAYDLGANSYLVKPARQDALLRLVERIDGYWIDINEPAVAMRAE